MRDVSGLEQKRDDAQSLMRKLVLIIPGEARAQPERDKNNERKGSKRGAKRLAAKQPHNVSEPHEVELLALVQRNSKQVALKIVLGKDESRRVRTGPQIAAAQDLDTAHIQPIRPRADAGDR